MPLPDKHKFKAIIVGGSVAGLTLAHAFSHANIDYVLLEARDTISPQIGASIVIMPNGARILDQMGLYDELRREIMTPMTRSFLRQEDDGRLVSSNEWPRMVEERLGYTCGISERMLFLRSMYGQLKDKSKVRLSKKVVSIQHGSDSVTVKCEDGSEFTGDVVIGADGIHSRTRTEMQRYARETGPPGLMDKDENCITAEYTCIFGISRPIPTLHPGDNHVSSSIDHSGLMFITSDRLPQWFFISKMPSKTIGSSIPRFTGPQMRAEVQKFADFKFTDTVTFGDLTERAEKMSWFALEEANHEVWTYGRVVCLGDAIHKMTPNLGQGGNQAIESAAVLTNCLVEMLDGQEGNVDLGELQGALRKYQDLRQRRAEKFIRLSGMITRNEALETLRHVLRFLYFEPLSGEMLADIQTEMYHTAPYLNFLPLPSKTRDNELWIEGMKRVKARKDVPLPKYALPGILFQTQLTAC
ncbi:FAD/NAD(P)-binding domain-containing protein [Mollisia scopiformis]|uniref:FAD/NAD(P)-binding domain-containing protein n=1 Tax=Mollisia scopiformis TaxID=149040 RepID=A0A194WWW6_MOLSC|nr:FAD/NAD(P)-binding domain-containing protein [Mollisia scopiformis]KUJ12473.1 FAD/NAD(P)-binding domain-containing protein [Mollisia scopiformis]